VDPVPDPLLLRKSGSAGIEPGTSGSVDRKSDHWTTEAVSGRYREIKILDLTGAQTTTPLGRSARSQPLRRREDSLIPAWNRTQITSLHSYFPNHISTAGQCLGI
jgi:hypothetical protein